MDIDDEDRDIPGPLQPAVDALDDAHQSWHDAERCYHDAADFRRHAEQTIQTLRNVTFRLQSNKSEMPDFDGWYPEWVSIMKGDVYTSWINDARTDLVHRSGLERRSRARLKLIRSYLDEPELVGVVPATKDSLSIVRDLVKRIPRDERQYAAVEVSRLWESPQHPGVDLLFIATRAFRVLDALLSWAAARILGADAANQSPTDFLSSCGVPECMALPPSIHPQIVAADTMQSLHITWDSVSGPGGHEGDRAEAISEMVGGSPGGDFSRHILSYHDAARSEIKKHGQYRPLLAMRRADGTWDHKTTLPADRREKYLSWYLLSKEVEYLNVDALVFTGEMWLAPADSIDTSSSYPPDLAGLPETREALVTWGETAEGARISVSSEIVRMAGRVYLKGPDRVDDAEEGGFSSPIRRVWERRRSTGQVP